jgi:hypothetical protein
MKPHRQWHKFVGGRGVEPGQQFMPSSLQLGTVTVGPWEIVELFKAADGLPYARLANAADRSRIKTVAEAALLDRHLFRRVEPKD